jgi:RNA polymerase sigma-70 factor (ECF subfamily)
MDCAAGRGSLLSQKSVKDGACSLRLVIWELAMNASPSTRYSLLLSLKDPRNHAAWVEFVAIYEPLVYGLARRKGLQDADARNLCQEVFQVVAKSARRWTPESRQGSFRGWLFRVARNLIIDSFRQQKRQACGTGDSDVQRLLEGMPLLADEHERLIEAEYRRHVFYAAARSIETEFSASTWQAFWRTAVQSEAVADVAIEIGMSPGAVYIARSRVVARLCRRVKEIEGEE